MASTLKKRKLESPITAYFTAQSCSTGSETHSSELSENPTDAHDSNSELESELECETEPLSTKPVCNSFCCTSTQIYQSTDADVFRKTERIYGSGSSRCTRRLLPSWYKSYPWLHFCCSTLRVYCYQCKLATQLNVRMPKAHPAFSTEGFCKWRKSNT